MRNSASDPAYLTVTVGDVVLDGFDVFAPLSAEKAREIITRVAHTVATARDEVPIVSFAEAHERGRYSAQRGIVIFYLAGFSPPALSWFKTGRG